MEIQNTPCRKMAAYTPSHYRCIFMDYCKPLFFECHHTHLSSDDSHHLDALTSGSPAYAALQSVILDTRLLKNIAKLSDFCHTGVLEVYHSVLTKYCPKRQHFSYRGMVARTQLAALDHNHNTGRNQATTATGEEKRYNWFSQSQETMGCKPIHEPEYYSYLDEMMTKVIEAREKKPNIQSKHKAQTTSCSIASKYSSL